MHIFDAVAAFADNYIWLAAETGRRHVAIVDPGDAGPLLAHLEARSLQPEVILVTHHHRDHTGGIAELLMRYDIPVYGPAKENISGISHPVGEGDVIHLQQAGLQLEVMETPGHTLGHVCYAGPGVLLCGDTLFTAGCGRLFEGSPQQMHASLSRIASLPANTQIYCAHEYTADNLKFAQLVEPDNADILARIASVDEQRRRQQPTVPSTLAEELQTNPFLRYDIPAVRQAAEAFASRTLKGGAEVFAVLRAWKDSVD